MTESRDEGFEGRTGPIGGAPGDVSPHEDVVADLGPMRDLVEDLASLPTEARLPRDLWPGIRSRIAGSPVPGVVHLDAVRERTPRRFSFSLTQLVAAGVALAFVSGASVWLALAGEPQGVVAGVTPVLAPSAVAVADEGGLPAATVRDYENAVAELEMILEEGRLVLGHETIATIEASLAAIDEAIDDARDALEGDPGSEVLNRLLTRSMWKKMEILRQTAVAIRARST